MPVLTVAKKKPTPKPTPSAFGLWVKTTRESKGLTLEALALAAGVHRVSISKIEAGTTQDPSLTIARKIAEAMGFSLADIPSDD